MSDLVRECTAGKRGPAILFPARHRSERLVITLVTAAEIAAMYADTRDAHEVPSHYRQLRLTPEVDLTALIVDHEPDSAGERLGGNDNWIARSLPRFPPGSFRLHFSEIRPLADGGVSGRGSPGMTLDSPVTGSAGHRSLGHPVGSLVGPAAASSPSRGKSR